MSSKVSFKISEWSCPSILWVDQNYNIKKYTVRSKNNLAVIFPNLTIIFIIICTTDENINVIFKSLTHVHYQGIHLNDCISISI